MNAGEATIEQLARDVSQITDPDTALRALTALRQELDATEPELVLRALQDGASWSQVESQPFTSLRCHDGGNVPCSTRVDELEVLVLC